jgi:hypothetical protein
VLIAAARHVQGTGDHGARLHAQRQHAAAHAVPRSRRQHLSGWNEQVFIVRHTLQEHALRVAAEADTGVTIGLGAVAPGLGAGEAHHVAAHLRNL